MVNRRLYLCGEGSIRFTPPPGTMTLDLELSPSGHLMLPYTEAAPAKTVVDKTKVNLSFTAEDTPEGTNPVALQ